MPPGSLFDDLDAVAGPEERFDPLLTTPGVKIERIVSFGHRSPEGFWYDQEWAEWVLLLRGRAGVELAGEGRVRELRAGDHLLIPAHCRHRVAWTAEGEPTVWLAVHYPPTDGPAPRHSLNPEHPAPDAAPGPARGSSPRPPASDPEPAAAPPPRRPDAPGDAGSGSAAPGSA